MQTLSYVTSLSDEEVSKLTGNTITIDVFREGSWIHPKYGKIVVTKDMLNDFVTNWKNNVLGREIIFDKNHNPDEGGTAIVKNLFIDKDKLKATVELTPFGIDLIKNKGFRYFSPEYATKYVDKETGKTIKNVLIGGALTLRPFLTGLSPIILSENINICSPVEDFREYLWNLLLDYGK